MTEQQWLEGTDSTRLVCALRGRSDRKLRLIGCALSRTFWAQLSQLAKEAVEVAEGYADGLVDEIRRKDYVRRLELTGGGDCRRVRRWIPRCAVSECGWYAAELSVGSGEIESSLETSILREIFGNPFRPVVFASEWRSDTALSLAKHIYEARDFDSMPILADALQDAGCDNTDILSHCRDTSATHVRGCWVLDLVLGKE